MARVRMVTRTVTGTRMEVICMNVETVETTIQTYELGGNLDKATALKQLKKLYETDTFKIVAIQSMETFEELYGLTEVEFLKVAKKLENRNGKLLAGDSEEEIEPIEEEIEPIEEEPKTEPKAKGNKKQLTKIAEM